MSRNTGETTRSGSVDEWQRKYLENMVKERNRDKLRNHSEELGSKLANEAISRILEEQGKAE